MALTPEDVVNKRFQPTKFREGYDQDEVDDFLDEVVVELRRLNQENEELRQRLVPPSAGSTSSSAAAAARTRSPHRSPYRPPSPRPWLGARAARPPTAADEPTSTNNLLQLARRLHEEHVREGIEKRDALIAEGHATAARVVAEAEAKQRAQIGALEQERVRSSDRSTSCAPSSASTAHKLKSYIEGQLRDLDADVRPRLHRRRRGAPAVRADQRCATTHAAAPSVPGLWRPEPARGEGQRRRARRSWLAVALVRLRARPVRQVPRRHEPARGRARSRSRQLLQLHFVTNSGRRVLPRPAARPGSSRSSPARVIVFIIWFARRIRSLGLGDRVRAAARRRARQPHRPAASARPASESGTSSTSSQSRGAPGDLQRGRHRHRRRAWVLFIILTLRGIGLDGSAHRRREQRRRSRRIDASATRGPDRSPTAA